MKLKLAVIGCGRISSKHIEACFKNSDKIELSAVCDKIPDRAEEKAEEYMGFQPGSVPAVYGDYMKMLSEIKPDIAAVSTESGYHCRISLDALNAGANVIVEKPMALSTGDAEAMIRRSREVNKKLAVCFQNRFNEPVLKVYEALKKERFGRMMHGMIQVRWNRNDQYYREADWRGTWELDGGTLMNQCTHGVDVLQWLMDDEIVKVHGVTRRFLRPIEAEDFCSAILEFKNGSVGIIEGSADIYPKNLNETLSIFGEKGSAVVGGLCMNRLETWRFSDSSEAGDSEEKMIDPMLKDPPTVYGTGHSAVYADFVRAIETGSEPFISGEEGKKSLDIILAVYKSMKLGKPVRMPVNFDTVKMKGTFKERQGGRYGKLS